MKSIGEEAARWLAELREGDVRQAEFLAWLRRSPQHVEEFLFATTLWRKLRKFGEAQPERVAQLIAAAESLRRESDNVVSLDEAPGALSSRRAGPRVKEWAIAATVLITLAGAMWMYATRPPAYGTDIGEQRTVRLEDGSRVDLNTRSKIAVRYSGSARQILLLEGEALFTVAKDTARPFSVVAGDTVVQALGTQFNVYRRPNETKISVVEGTVRVAESTELTAGEEAQVARNGGIARPFAPDISRSIAWRERRLVFRADRLEDVAAEVSRYSTLAFHFKDPAERNLRLTAIFDADDPLALVRFLERMDGLILQRDDNTVTVRTR